MSETDVIMTTKGYKQAISLLMEAELTRAEHALATETELTELVRGPTPEELMVVLVCWGAMQNESRSQAWFHGKCLEVLRAMSSPAP